MNTALITLLAIAATSLAGMIAILKSMANAPEGFEDADGFHYAQPAQQTVQSASHQVAA